MDDLPIETIAIVNLARPIALSILGERGPSRERSLATVAPYLRITSNPGVIPKVPASRAVWQASYRESRFSEHLVVGTHSLRPRVFQTFPD
jgi:hypothetical protein